MFIALVSATSSAMPIFCAFPAEQDHHGSTKNAGEAVSAILQWPASNSEEILQRK